MLLIDPIDLRDDLRDDPRNDPRSTVSRIGAHGTGVSPDDGTVDRSFARPSLTLVLSVLGNGVAGALFLGGLFLAPLALQGLVGRF